ncbi:MAG: hypothetical protein AVDCRST_MAG60-281, partial [uncultured Nocardioides sp.]
EREPAGPPPTEHRPPPERRAETQRHAGAGCPRSDRRACRGVPAHHLGALHHL